MDEEEIKKLEQELEESKVYITKKFELLKRIYKLCKTGLIPMPKTRFLRIDEYCPRCGTKLVSERVYCFNHLFCFRLCGYEWIYAMTSDKKQEEMIEKLKEEVGLAVKLEI